MNMFIEEIEIVLASGDIATIQLTSELLRRIREVYSLGDQEKPSPNQVKYFLAKSMQNALKVM